MLAWCLSFSLSIHGIVVGSFFINRLFRCFRLLGLLGLLGLGIDRIFRLRVNGIFRLRIDRLIATRISVAIVITIGVTFAFTLLESSRGSIVSLAFAVSFALRFL